MSHDWLEEQLAEDLIYYDINTEKYFVWAKSSITGKNEPIWLHDTDQSRMKRMRDNGLLRVAHIGMTNKCTVRLR